MKRPTAIDASRSCVIVLGLDGATFDMLDPWIDQGHLPHLHTAIRRGARGRLRSIMPPYSVPAWMSFATGKHPAKHGMTGFWRPAAGPAKRELNSARSLSSATLWRILSDAGRQVGVVNVPGTYPPAPVNGFLISGLMTPSEDVDYAFPPSLKDELLQVIGDYAANPYASVAQTSDFLRHVIYWERTREAAHHYLLANRAWDFFVNVVQGLDPVQHKFWQYLAAHPPPLGRPEAQRYAPLLEECLAVIDEVVGHRLSLVGERTTLFIVSDHGFGPMHKYFHLNRFLADMGLISFKSGNASRRGSHTGSWPGRILSRAAATLRRLDVLGLRHGLLDNVARYRLRQMLDLASTPPIDWANTRAYCNDASSEGIYVYRDTNGGMSDLAYEHLRTSLIEELNALRDPDTGKPVIDGAYRREDVHQGPYVHLLPDIVLDIGRRPYLVTERLAVPHVIEPAGPQDSGRHRPDGVFVAVGPEIRRNAQLTDVSLVDLAPTILYTLGLGVPDDMDGRVLTEIFEPGYLTAHPVTRIEATPSLDSVIAEYAYTDAEANAIQARLRALGYTE